MYLSKYVNDNNSSKEQKTFENGHRKCLKTA